MLFPSETRYAAGSSTRPGIRMLWTLLKTFLFQSICIVLPEKANPICPSEKVIHMAFCQPVRL